MDQVNPFSSLNGSPNQEPAPQLMDISPSNYKIITKEQNSDGSKESEKDDGISSARGLELIYKVAEELATRIADEKRYEGIIRPCSVKIQRISDASRFRIIRDESMITKEFSSDIVTITESEVKTDVDSNQPPENVQMEYSDSSDDEEEIILPPVTVINKTDTESPQEKIAFICIFCRENIQGKSTAIDHYQSHLDYYPYKCGQCLEVTTDLQSLFTHYRKDHKEAKTATLKKQLKPWITEWIEDFLKPQMHGYRGRHSFPRPYCPVCETREKKEDIVIIPPNLIQPRKHLIHVYKHLSYEPFVCMICQKDGKKFTTNEFDEKMYEHILKNHPEAEDERLASIFQKSRYIKPLENYTIAYLTSAGISTRVKRPEKIPHVVRNRYKARHESKDNINSDINLPTTLSDTTNQSSSILLNNQSDGLSIDHKSDNLINLSNQTKVNPITSTAHQMSNPPSTVHKPVNILAVPNLLMSPSKGPSPQLTTIAVNNPSVPNVYTVTSVAMIPNNSTINGVTSPQPLLLPTYQQQQQQPSIIQLPCGQIMIRKTVNTNSNSISMPKTSIPSPIKSTFGSSILRSPPTIIRRASVTITPPEPSVQNGPIQIQSCPDVSALTGRDVANMRKQEEGFVKRSYFCMFCKEMIRFESFTDGLFHFSNHLDYRPVNCLLCGDKFAEIDSIMDHFVENHSHRKMCRDNEGCEPLLYYINRDGHVEKWIEQYLYFQLSGEFERLTNVDCSSFCVICKSVQTIGRSTTRVINKKPTSQIVPPIEVVRLHINLHVNYRPYECYFCAKAGDQVKFGSIGETALKHLKSHGFSPVDCNFYKEFFHHKPILELENFIKNYLITEFYSYANVNARHESVDITHSIEQSVPFMSNGEESNLRAYILTSDKPKRLLTDTNHTNNESISSSPFSPSPPSRNNDQKTLTGSALACYHCKLSINGLHELVTHCKSIHPNISIASYCLPSLNGVD